MMSAVDPSFVRPMDLVSPGTARGRDGGLPASPPTAPAGAQVPQLQAIVARADTLPQGALNERLESLAPELARTYQALRELVARQNPEAAEAMDDKMRKVLNHLERMESHVASGSRPTVTVRRARIQVAIETSVTSLQIQMENGRAISVERVEVTFTTNFATVMGQADPLVLDINGNGVFDTTSAQNGHDFDILGNGQPVRVATAVRGDGLLVLDRNGNGQIDSGREMFGDQNGAVDGFAELARFDDVRDGQIDEMDAVFDHLQVLRDWNLNGRVDPGELLGLFELGITSLLLATEATDESSNGNRVVKAASYVRSDGSTGRVGELLLNYLA